MSKSTKINNNKKALIEAMQSNFGNVTKACKSAKLDRGTYYNYYNDDKEFAAACDEAGEIAIDFVENKLMQSINSDNVTAMIFFLKTRAKHRGYVERSEFTGKDGKDLIPDQQLTGADLLAAYKAQK